MSAPPLRTPPARPPHENCRCATEGEAACWHAWVEAHRCRTCGQHLGDCAATGPAEDYPNQGQH